MTSIERIKELEVQIKFLQKAGDIIKNLEKENKLLHAVVGELEWIYWGHCPLCGTYKEDGHAQDCIVRLIKDASLMKLWLLKPVEGLDEKDNPWSPWYDKCFGFVVRAETEEHARETADSCSKGEAGAWSGNCRAWFDKKYSICDELTTVGPEEVIMRDVDAA